jgi:hypothetical protein
MSVRITYSDHGLSVRLMNAGPGVQKELRHFVDAVVLDAEGNVVRLTPVGASGHLKQSIKPEVNISGLGIVGRVYSSDVPVKVASVEEGRRPGKMPPRRPIEMWVARRIGGDNVRAVAFLIARKIGREGTKGKWMFRDGFQATKPRIDREARGLADRIGRLL